MSCSTAIMGISGLILAHILGCLQQSGQTQSIIVISKREFWKDEAIEKREPNMSEVLSFVAPGYVLSLTEFCSYHFEATYTWCLHCFGNPGCFLPPPAAFLWPLKTSDFFPALIHLLQSISTASALCSLFLLWLQKIYEHHL